MGQKTVTETQIGNTLFIVTSECSPTATETIEKKLERLICRHVSDTKYNVPMKLDTGLRKYRLPFTIELSEKENEKWASERFMVVRTKRRWQSRY